MARVTGGSKEKLGPRKWRIRISLGKDPVTGKYMRSPSRIVYGNKKDADQALADLRAELQDEIDHPGSRLTFREYAQDFFANREILGESPLSRKSEKLEINKLIDMFGDTSLTSITSEIVKKTYLSAKRDGMTPATLKRVSKRLKMILEEALDDGIIERNPAAKIKVPEPKRNPPQALSEDEAARLARILGKKGPNPMTVAIRLMLYGGLRKGEALGLDWQNVDFDSNAIFICKQFSNDRQLRPPKSARSRRWVHLDEETMEFLKAWKDLQADSIDSRLGFVQMDDTPLVTNALGENTDPTNFNRAFRDFCVEHGFGSYGVEARYVDDRGYVRRRAAGYKGLTPHGLRHTHATLLIGNNTDVKSVSTRLGHSNYDLVLSVYADAIAKNDVEAAGSIGRLRSGQSHEKED